MNAGVRALLGLVAGLCLAPTLAHADIPVNLPSIKDMTIYGTANGASDLGAPPHNAGANADMLVGSVGRCGAADQGARRRGLIAFDIAQIPTGSTVTSAQLKLFLTIVALENTASQISVSRISNGYPWTESTNAGGGWPGQPAINGDPGWCWLSYPFVTWPCGGPTDRLSDTSGVLQTAAQGTVITWSAANILNDVQEWVNNTHQNNGWRLTNSIEGTFTAAPPNADATTRRFGSREAAAANQPVLAVTYKLKQGSTGCGANDQCATGFCTNGVCCNVGACPAQQACNSSAPVCQAGSGVCSNPLSSSGVCRPAAGVCDVPESCNGSSAACPADVKSTAVCRPSAGVCDPAESCDNVNVNCPTDKKSTAVCRPSAGVCDPAESCDNVSNACPADAKSTAVCRPSAGVCDPAESCDNLNNACPTDAKSTAVCRSSAGVCDPAESCDNVNNACPTDAKSTAVCRPSAGVCDPAESCDNVGNNCPADAKSTAVCRPSAGACDPAESCDNVGNNCPADAKSSAVCRPSAGVCDVPESCSGGNTCPADTKVALDTPCPDDGNVCTADKCDGSSPVCQHPAGNLGSVCRPTTGVCDPAEACSGSSTSCPADLKSTAVCRPAAGVCDVAESCNGVSGACPADGKSTAVCRPSAGICDLTETCDGTNVNCPGDGFVANTQQCRGPSCTSGTETLAANCTGTGAICPAPVTQSCAPLSCSGTACGGNCTGDADCSGGLHCVDQICCDTTCGGGDPSDCQACNVAGHLGTCFASPNTYVCRAAAGICDKADTCDGSSLTCPVDGKQSVTTVCRGSAGPCDLDDKCDGATNTCPADAKASTTQVCRPSAGPCDVDDKCNGTLNTCPADAKAMATQVCRPSAGPCDVDDKCDGTTNACTADIKVAVNQGCPDDGSICSTDKCDGVSDACQHVPGNPGVQCRAANGSACDVADFCTGTTAACVDGKQSSSFVCRPAAGECDVADTCDGTNDPCPADQKAAANSGCSDDGNPCTTDKCNGTSVTCSHAAGNANVQCRAANGSACDVADTCDGVTTTCADAKAGITFICRPAAGDCDVADTCSGTADACPADTRKTAGSPCPDDGLPCTTDKCDAASPLCQHVAGNLGAVCRPATGGTCDAPESCDGTHASCPADGYLGPTVQCQASACSSGVETVATKCTGTGPACPTATTKPCGAFACGPTACLTTCAADADCSPGNFCANGKCTAQVGTGTACTTSASCLSSFCVDGVCCNNDCTGQCEACNVSGKSGTCSPLTGPPTGARAACPGDGTACKGTCNGVNTQSCTFPGSTTQCRAPSCANGSATLAEFCTGSGSCPPPRLQDCGGAVCGPTQCQGCATDGECPAGKFCRGGVCNPLATVGTSCSRDGECAGGHCVDRVCCDSDCVGQCETCNDPSKPGTCIAVSGVPRNRPACNGVGGACAGTCDGTNGRTCTYPGFGVVCHDAACANDIATPPVFCDGNGTCPAAVPQPCPAGSSCSGVLCAGGSNTCTGTCSVLGTYCSSGVCVPEKELGAPCNSPIECASSFCVDGTCCSEACSGQCEACDVSGNGTCTPVSANTAPHGARRACASDGSDCAGRCDGIKTDSCAYPGNTKNCRPPSCVNGIATLETGCQGDGTCGPFQQQNCGGEICDIGGIVCSKGCRLDVDCMTPGQFCSGGVCIAKRSAGAVCGTDAQCALGHCVDHVCCDTACDGQCESCNQSANPGKCLPVAGVPRGGRPACAGSSACGGFCDGTNGNACRLPGSSTSCGVPLCENAAVSEGATCANTICIPATPQSCEPYVCDPTGQSCVGDCATDQDCTSGSICLSDGHCGTPVPDGGTTPGPDASTGGGGAGGASQVDAGAAGAAAGTGGSGAGTGGVTQGGGGASGGSADAGTQKDGGARDGGKGASSGDKGSCGCRVPGRSSSGHAPLAAAVASGLLFALRRRRQRGSSLTAS